MFITQGKLAGYLESKGIQIYDENGWIDNHLVCSTATKLGCVFDSDRKEWMMPYDLDLIFGKDVFLTLTKEDIEYSLNEAKILMELNLSEEENEKMVEALFSYARHKYEVDITDLTDFVKMRLGSLLTQPHF